MEVQKYQSGDLRIHLAETKQVAFRSYYDFMVLHNGKLIKEASGEDYSIGAMVDIEDVVNDIIEWCAYDDERIYELVEWDEDDCEVENRFIIERLA